VKSGSVDQDEYTVSENVNELLSLDVIARGQADSDNLVPLLAALFTSHYSIRTNYHLVFDIGANLGRTSSFFVRMLTDHACRTSLDKGVGHESCRPLNKEAVILSFEPVPSTFELLAKASEINNWSAAPLLAFRAAVSDQHLGELVFYAGKAGDEQASQDIEAASSSNSIRVTSVSVDGLLNGNMFDSSASKSIMFSGNANSLKEWSSIAQLDVFLLKIDTEGYDYFVLYGARAALQKKRIEFIVFEYNSKWFTKDRTVTLKQTVEMMFSEFHYLCFYITLSLNSDL
jgi:FkbM family methyltransferase